MDPAPDGQILRDLQTNWVWVSDWIDAPTKGEAARLVVFRCSLAIERSEDLPPTALIRLSADTRYKLLINGIRVCVGPTRGSDRLWYYDTVDVGPFLRTGVNDIQIKVLRYFPGVDAGIPFARTAKPGLTVLGTVAGQDLSTGSGKGMWRCQVQGQVYYTSKSKQDIFLHTYETVKPRVDDDPWLDVERYKLIGHYGILPPWRLSPRMIPLAQELPAVLKAITVDDSTQPTATAKWEAFLHGEQISLLPDTTHRIELEYEVHSTAFLRLLFEGGDNRGSHLSITYSECYETVPPLPGRRHGKGDRTKKEGQVLVGPSDTYEFGKTEGGGDEVYEPFWWKTFRFLAINIRVGPNPLQLRSLVATQTNYPMAVTAKWCEPQSDERRAMWDISVRTLRNCMFDGYSDCPFYEQLQYCEDARSAMLFHYVLSGDDRLARQAIVAFAASIQPDGLICGRYPAHGTQIITGFALFWVLQVCDHMLHFSDKVFAERFLNTIDSVFTYFEGKVCPTTGLVSGLPPNYWSFVDWHEAWTEDQTFLDPGVPRAGRKTATWSFFSMLYVYTLRQACKLLRQLDKPALFHEYTARADRTTKAVIKHCFDGRYFTDSIASLEDEDEDRADAPHYSQHSQLWAILCGAVAPEELPTLGRRLMSDAFAFSNDARGIFAACSYPMLHYAFRALSSVGLYDDLFEYMWDPWRRMIANNLTTWQEDEVNARSDCHEWSSLPIWEFATEVAGLTPLRPGWTKVLFAPRVALAPELDAAVNMGNRGLATVVWSKSKTDHGSVRVQLRLPQPTALVSRLPGKGEVDHGVVQGLETVITISG